MINNLVRLEVISDPSACAEAGSPDGKPYLRIKRLQVRLPGGTIVEADVDLTINLGHMIGGVAQGAAERFNLPW